MSGYRLELMKKMMSFWTLKFLPVLDVFDCFSSKTRPVFAKNSFFFRIVSGYNSLRQIKKNRRILNFKVLDRMNDKNDRFFDLDVFLKKFDFFIKNESGLKRLLQTLDLFRIVLGYESLRQMEKNKRIRNFKVLDKMNDKNDELFESTNRKKTKRMNETRERSERTKEQKPEPGSTNRFTTNRVNP